MVLFLVLPDNADTVVVVVGLGVDAAETNLPA
jgi:hypothetical protein